MQSINSDDDISHHKRKRGSISRKEFTRLREKYVQAGMPEMKQWFRQHEAEVSIGYTAFTKRMKEWKDKQKTTSIAGKESTTQPRGDTTTTHMVQQEEIVVVAPEPEEIAKPEDLQLTSINAKLTSTKPVSKEIPVSKELLNLLHCGHWQADTPGKRKRRASVSAQAVNTEQPTKRKKTAGKGFQLHATRVDDLLDYSSDSEEELARLTEINQDTWQRFDTRCKNLDNVLNTCPEEPLIIPEPGTMDPLSV